jgi:hypothetical protein
MAFLQSTDHILIMNINPQIPFFHFRVVDLKEDELKVLRQAGATVVCEYLWWQQLEPRKGVYEWEQSDRMVERARRANLKIVLNAWSVPPTWFPDDWYASFAPRDTLCRDILSLWHREAQAYMRGFMNQLVARYSGPDVLVVLSEYLTGESILHNCPCFYDAAALADYKQCYGTGRRPEITELDTLEWLRRSVVQHYLDAQSVLVEQHNEVWDALQWLIARQSWANGNYAQPDLLAAYRQRWPTANIVLIQYTYFAHGPEYFSYIQDLRKRLGLHLIVEAQYCEGLQRGSAAWAREQGANGQIVAPLHPFTGHTCLEPWMAEAIQQAASAWMGLQ